MYLHSIRRCTSVRRYSIFVRSLYTYTYTYNMCTKVPSYFRCDTRCARRVPTAHKRVKRMRSIFVLPGKSQHSHVVSHIVRRARGRQISAAACQVQSYGPLCRSSVVLLKRRTNLDVQNALLARYHRHYFKYEDRRQMMSFQSHACHKPTFDAANGRYTESFLLVRWTVFLR